MAELLLTDAEKAAELWTDLDDASLGAMLRKKLIVLQTASEQMEQTFSTTAGLLLCCAAAEKNANEMTLTFENVTQEGRPFGDWKVVVTRLDTPEVKS